MNDKKILNVSQDGDLTLIGYNSAIYKRIRLKFKSNKI